MNKERFCDCTSVHNICSNQPKIDAARSEFSDKVTRLQEDYVNKMREIGESTSHPCIPATFIVRNYDKGIVLYQGMLKDIISKCEDACPMCNKKYDHIEILQKSYGPCGETFIKCIKCGYAAKWDEYSDC